MPWRPTERSRRAGRGNAVTRLLSPRLAEIVAALPLRPGMRVLEIGCGPGAERIALGRIRDALAPGARLFIDGGDPLRRLL